MLWSMTILSLGTTHLPRPSRKGMKGLCDQVGYFTPGGVSNPRPSDTLLAVKEGANLKPFPLFDSPHVISLTDDVVYLDVF